MRALYLGFLTFFISAVVQAADLPSMNEASDSRYKIIITEVIMDDDGAYAALPAQGTAGGNWKHSAEVDLVLELRNISGSDIDIEGWTIWYVTEPYDFSVDSTLRATGTTSGGLFPPAYDLCGIQSNSTHGDNVQSNTLNVSLNDECGKNG